SVRGLKLCLSIAENSSASGEVVTAASAWVRTVSVAMASSSEICALTQYLRLHRSCRRHDFSAPALAADPLKVCEASLRLEPFHPCSATNWLAAYVLRGAWPAPAPDARPRRARNPPSC